ncbi:hypothetical protein BVU17_01055 [Haloarcula taiwanensis]|uniref:histidine kinase n=1 Tax=Haloarcula taiwanensis TaxID=1932004 RepID=A0A2H4ZUM2_9EURY|nr:HAMP domain-containing sensor histidine kinase [Haloarcula taiwanensis]AUG46180.1 hypothetical protein BVU17_01055 [Haloarcula taiwanensis]
MRPLSDGSDWETFADTYWPACAVVAGSALYVLVQLLLWPWETAHALPDVVGEGAVVLALLAAVFVVQRIPERRLYRPLMGGLTVFHLFALTDFLDEFVSPPNAYGLLFENGAQAVGTVLLVVGIYRWTVARREREQELQSRTDQLEVLNRLLRNDVRNDTMVIRGWASVLQREAGADADDCLGRIVAAANGIIDLTETTEEFTDALTTAETVDLERRSLAPTIEGEVEKLRARYDGARVEIDGSLPRVDVVAHSMLPAVFRNLLTNAVEHNDAATPTVRVSAERVGDAVHVRVADNGPGIPDDRKDAVFARTESGDGPPTSGFGLYLVKTLVAEFGGDVRVADAETGGAVFTVVLRVASSGPLPDFDPVDARSPR